MERDYHAAGGATPPFSLRQLSYLIAAAEAGTIAKAAEKLHVSPSAMSAAITELERLTGTRLCVRRKAQGLSLTSAGVRAVAEAKVLLRGAHELYVSLHADHELVGPVAVGCFSTLAPTVLPPLLSEFGSAHPRIDIEVLEADQDDLVRLLDTGRIDVAFVYDHHIPGRVRRATLFALSPHVLLPASHRLAGASGIRLEEIVGEDLILLDAPPVPEKTLSIFEAQGLTPRIRHRTANPEVVRTLVGRGLGYGMMVQRPSAHSGAQNHPIVLKDVVPTIPPLATKIIWSSALTPAPRVQAMIDYARTIDWPSPSTVSSH